MKCGFLIFFAVLFACSFSSYKAFAEMGEVVEEPICFGILNTTEQNVFGTIRTDRYTRPDGVQARHTSSFRLKPKGAVNEETGYPIDRVEFCSRGPFYPGRKVDLVLKTLFPVFDCKTRVDQGVILVKRKKIEDDPMGGYRLFAECFE